MQENLNGVVPSLVLKVSSYRYNTYSAGCRAVIVSDRDMTGGGGERVVYVGSVIKMVEADLMGQAVGVPEPNFKPREDLFFRVVHLCLACEGMSGRYCLLTIEKLELIENDYDKEI